MQARCRSERDGNMPQDRLTPPARGGPSAPSARNRSGALALMALLALILLALLPAVYHSVGSPQDPYLSYLAYFAYFYRRRSKRVCLGRRQNLRGSKPSSGALYTARLNSLRKNSLIEGHDFSRAVSVIDDEGFRVCVRTGGEEPHEGHGFSRAEEAMLSDRLQPLRYVFRDNVEPQERLESIPQGLLSP